MVKITKIGDINCNSELKCEFCREFIVLGMPHYSIIVPIPNNPPHNFGACRECIEKYKDLKSCDILDILEKIQANK